MTETQPWFSVDVMEDALTRVVMDAARVDGRGGRIPSSLEGRKPGRKNRAAASGKGAPKQRIPVQ